MRKDMLSKILVIGIVMLFIGVGSVSSIEYIAKESESNPLNINFKMGSPTVLLYENFSGTFPPDGWSTDWWTQCNYSCGITEPSSACLKRGNFNKAYITSKAVDASNYEKVILRFTFRTCGDNYCVFIRVRINETSPWRNYTLWDCPIQEDLFLSNYEMKFNFEPEHCADAFQVNWTITWYYPYGFQEACLDDVLIYYPSPNNPPDTPTINGPTCGKPNTEYDFSFNATDPESDIIKYIIDWGDDNIEETEYFDSGKEILLKHNWSEKGVYIIKAKAIDILGAESDWNEFIITIKKKSKSTVNYLLLWFLERFPLLERLLNLI